MGRPTRVYSLSEAADDLFPKKYGAFTLEMLDFLAQEDELLIERFFAARAQRLIDRFGPAVTDGASLKDRVARLTDIQLSNGYLANWDNGSGEVFTLREFNCPVHQVSRKYPHACRHELSFFKTVLGTENIERVECIAEGGTCCRYAISESKDNA